MECMEQRSRKAGWKERAARRPGAPTICKEVGLRPQEATGGPWAVFGENSRYNGMQGKLKGGEGANKESDTATDR